MYDGSESPLSASITQALTRAGVKLRSTAASADIDASGEVPSSNKDLETSGATTVKSKKVSSSASIEPSAPAKKTKPVVVDASDNDNEDNDVPKPKKKSSKK